MAIRKILTAAMLVTGIAAFAGSAYATPMITGSISLSGPVTGFDATSITFDNPADITGVSGSFSELGSASHTCYGCVTMGSPFSNTSMLPFQLFTATSNSNTVTLMVTSDQFSYDSNTGNLTITGMGIMSLAGFTDTTAYFNLTAQQVGTASFSMSSAVPEPGTLALFGAGLLSCALFIGRRRRSTQAGV